MSDEAQAKVEALEPPPPPPEASEGVDASEASETPDHPRPRREADELIPPRAWDALRKGLPVSWLAAGVAAGVWSGAALACLVLAAGALVLVLVLMWSSVQSLTGGASLGFEEALGMGAPSRVEEEKRAVLRALKDLEYERSVGKISAEDYAELSARYRAEAKRLMQTLDESLGPAREEVERAVAARLARAGVEPAPTVESKPTDDATRVEDTKPAVPEEKPAKTAESSEDGS